jgi:hypothetical protein
VRAVRDFPPAATALNVSKAIKVRPIAATLSAPEMSATATLRTAVTAMKCRYVKRVDETVEMFAVSARPISLAPQAYIRSAAACL